jgi:hypothetical protein
MKILLIGEYNSSHYTLKEGLESLGHNVIVIGFGDGFKKRMVDYNFERKYISGFTGFLKKVIYKLFKIDITSLAIKSQFFKHQEIFRGHDIVQLINENSFNCIPRIEMKLLEFVFKHNKNVFLLSCGTDYPSVKYAMDKKFRYSILTPYFEKKGNKNDFLHATQYLKKDFVLLHHYVTKNIKGVIASDLDYHIPLLGEEKYLGMIPNPINVLKLAYLTPKVDGKIVIFHGINAAHYYKKGNDIFEEALALVSEKYKDRIEIITVRSIPYAEYITLFDRAHILLDQVFAYDQGFNALEAMAKGKVVFTGAEKEWLDYYNLEENTVAINALPDPIKIAEKLEWLITNPNKIEEISRNARSFIEKEHDYKLVANLYFEKWQGAI